ncbi:MAG TPA: Spy/CpxP family protein refolding chaperone [Vicinamibacteria bacterium]|nr:Spy/CpxP family protein refolding chaperone [Vicinamibacteria bacterium]
MSDRNGTVETGRPRFWRRRSVWLAGGVVAALAVLVAVAPKAWAYRALVGHGFGGHPQLGAMLHDPAAAKAHFGTAVELALGGVSATDDQKQQARRITDRMVDDFMPLADSHRQFHQALVSELQKPQIDRAAVEQLRRQELALVDQASQKLVGDVADLASVLTSEQRTQLVQVMQRLHGQAPAAQ